jgi:hypothetical protein
MFNRCKHEWKIVARRFTPPPASFKGKASSREHMEEIMHGFTTIESRCDLCTKVIFTTVLGDQR